MGTGVISWSKTAADNATADSAINFAEGQAPSSVNDSARALMASVAKWRDDNSGSLVTGGTATAYTVTTNQGFASLSAMGGQTIRAKMNASNTGAATLNVDTLGAKSIVAANGSALGSGDLVSGCVYGFVYDNTNGVWIVHGGAPGAFPSGTVMLFQQTAAPTGWTKSTTHNNKALRVVSGTASSGGTSAFTTVFASRTIAQGNLPSYTLPSTLAISDPGHAHAELLSSTSSFTGGPAGGNTAAVTGGGTTNFGSTASATTGISITGAITSGGSGTAMDFAVQYVDVIAAIKN